ncbi:Spx/MgsR family RNA polymerase-binding regulatory protein [Hutsoniella sourekii]|uniref:Spx/MgsR family RNA polymerase-binding regulatory protein n=1 Tax=Hutsoniella sourekii TaxID=87650 RepID=UPI0004831610|nr:Spx/MgsR family RNA polymerase-binding regulatory protein [Hutsoniella sourekii]
MLKLYGIKKCSTVQRAIKYLEEAGVTIDQCIDYREETPSRQLLALALEETNGKPKKIINTSGQLYRDLGLKDKLDQLSSEEILDLLQDNGMLIKRPFITDGTKVTVGAKEDILDGAWIN